MNSVHLIGNLGGDPELRQTANGKAVANFSVAVPQFGENAKPLWVRCTAWGKTAENAAQYLAKGRQVGITGHLSPDKRVKTEKLSLKGGATKELKVAYESFCVTVDQLSFINDGKGQGGSGGGSQVDLSEEDFADGDNLTDPNTGEAQVGSQGSGGFSDDEIPF